MRLAMSLLHDEDDARDVVQEVFLKLWESGIQVDNPPAFIIRAVRNASLNRINTLETHERILKGLFLDQPPDNINIEQRNEEIVSAIRRLLTPREQQVVDKIYSEELSYKDTAESLGISVAAVNKYVVSALKKLRNHFKTDRS
ncbi:MAG: sigma-70 family RNA polymerase sigma factor [Muribaculaceae bacterium]|nr:sigma-70 family RNA polymerase sigma factor [Muribaculaceae bacterium]